MDKFVYVALGIGVLVVGALDQSDRVGKGLQPAATRTVGTSQLTGSGFSKASSPTNVGGGTAESPPPFLAPVNPTPEARNLGGKVIDDRFQPDA